MRRESEQFGQSTSAELGRATPEVHGSTLEEAILVAAERGYAERYLREVRRYPNADVGLEALARQRATEAVEERRKATKEHRAARTAFAFNLLDRLNRWAAMGVIAGCVGAGVADGSRGASGDQIESTDVVSGYGGGPLTEAGQKQAEAEVEAKLAGAFDENARAAQERRALAEAERMPDVALTGLHPEATPERMRRLMRDGLPRGWASNITSISFTQKIGEITKSYGLDEEAWAVASREAVGETNITYYRAATTYDLDENISGTLGHEGAHANDWDYASGLTQQQREHIKQTVISRLTAKDRFRSDYVESIKNPDAAIETQNKATEYWAETVDAYLNAEEPTSVLSPEDIRMIEDAIRLTDDHFNRDEARQARQTVIEEIQDASVEHELDGLIETMRLDRTEATELRSRLLARWAARHEPVDAEMQKAGRRAVMEIVSNYDGETWGRLLTVYDYRLMEETLDDLSSGRTEAAGQRLANLLERLEREKYFDDNHVNGAHSRRKLRAVFDNFGLRVGGEDDLVSLPPGEYAELLMWGFDDPTVLIRAAGWEAAPEDKALADFIEIPEVEITVTAHGKRPDRTRH
jgi:hypothetical protein